MVPPRRGKNLQKDMRILILHISFLIYFYVMQYILRRTIQETGVNGEKESEKPKSLKC